MHYHTHAADTGGMSPQTGQHSDQLLAAPCHTCGVTRLRPTAFHLTVFDHGDGAFFTFFCPGCTEEIRHDACLDTALALMAAGVATTEVHVPDEVLDPARSGPAISPDDVMEFVLALRAGDDYFWVR